MSSSWALGDHIALGLSVDGKAVENMNRHPECVVNVPNPSLWKNVEALAPFTGRNPVPDYKKEQGFQFKKDKFTVSLGNVIIYFTAPHFHGPVPLVASRLVL